MTTKLITGTCLQLLRRYDKRSESHRSQLLDDVIPPALYHIYNFMPSSSLYLMLQLKHILICTFIPNHNAVCCLLIMLHLNLSGDII